MNEYELFIAFLKQKHQSGMLHTKLVQKHHILPFHAGGLPKNETVSCSIQDHAQAHFIRYKVYGKIQDKIAAFFIQGQSEKAILLRQQHIVNTNRERKNTFFNSDWQTIQAKKPKSSYYLKQNPDKAKIFGKLGGEKGGKIMTSKKIANLTRLGKKVGTQFGRKNGIKSKQSAKTGAMLKKSLIWKHKTDIYVHTAFLETVSDLKSILNSFLPNSVPHSSGLSAILREVESQRYGWKIQNMAISSEAENGLEN